MELVSRSQNLLILDNFQFPMRCLIARIYFSWLETDFPNCGFRCFKALTVIHLFQDDRVVQSNTVFSINHELSVW